MPFPRHAAQPRRKKGKKKSKEELEAERIALEEETARLTEEADTLTAETKARVDEAAGSIIAQAKAARKESLEHLQDSFPGEEAVLTGEAHAVLQVHAEKRAQEDEAYHMTCSLLPHPARPAELSSFFVAVKDEEPQRDELSYTLPSELGTLSDVLRVSHRLNVQLAQELAAGAAHLAASSALFSFQAQQLVAQRLDAIAAWVLQHAKRFQKQGKDGREDNEVRLAHTVGIAPWPATTPASLAAAAPGAKADTGTGRGAADHALGTDGQQDAFTHLATLRGGGTLRFTLWVPLKDRSRSLEVHHHTVGIKVKIPKAITTAGLALRVLHTDYDTAAASVEAAAAFEAAFLAASEPQGPPSPRPGTAQGTGSPRGAGGGLDAGLTSARAAEAQELAAQEAAELAEAEAAEPEETLEDRIVGAAKKYCQAYEAHTLAAAAAFDAAEGACLAPLPALPAVEDKNLWLPLGGVISVELLEKPVQGKSIRRWTLAPASALHTTVRRRPHPYEGKGQAAQVHAVRLEVSMRDSLVPPPELYMAYWSLDAMVPEA
ncbi:casc1, partial [Symbiodinium sp. KB8]